MLIKSLDRCILSSVDVVIAALSSKHLLDCISIFQSTSLKKEGIFIFSEIDPLMDEPFNPLRAPLNHQTSDIGVA